MRDLTDKERELVAGGFISLTNVSVSQSASGGSTTITNSGGNVHNRESAYVGNQYVGNVSNSSDVANNLTVSNIAFS